MTLLCFARTRALRGFWVVVSWMLVMRPSGAHAICRVVESEDAPSVPFDATTSAFYVALPDVVLDYRCPEDALDGGVDASVASEFDAGEFDAGEFDASEFDAGEFDAGEFDAGEFDAGEFDAGEFDASEFDDDAGLDARATDASGLVDAPSRFDGGRLDATTPRRLCADGSLADEVRGPLVSLVLQPRLTGGGGHAGLIMPVAARPDVAAAPSDVFARLALASAQLGELVHETVIVTEDASLGFQCTDPHYTSEAESSPASDALAMVASAPLSLYGCASDSYYRPGSANRDVHTIDFGMDGTVMYESIPVSDAYDVTVLSASTADALTAWMDANSFAHDAIDDAAFAAYVGPGRWFVALDVHPPIDMTTEAGVAGLTPLVVSWPGSEIPIQHQLQFDPAGGTIITDAFVIAASRVDAEDGTGLTMASGNVRLDATLASFGMSSGVLTQLRVSRQQRTPMEDSRIIPVSGPLVLPPTVSTERTTNVRIPLACCQGGGAASRSAAPRTFTHERTWRRTMGAPEIPADWFRSPEHANSEPFCAQPTYASRGCFCNVASLPVSGFGPILFAVLWIGVRSRRRLLKAQR